MEIEVSIGEIVDKYTILKIKSLMIQDVEKKANVIKELVYITMKLNEMSDILSDNLCAKLLQINNELWNVEDELREYEKKKEFKDEFIELARSVYKLNDKRADLKKQINFKYNSTFTEEKSYN